MSDLTPSYGSPRSFTDRMTSMAMESPKVTAISVAFAVVAAVLLALVLYYALAHPSQPKGGTLILGQTVLAGGRTAGVQVSDTNLRTTGFYVEVTPVEAGSGRVGVPAASVQPAELQIQVAGLFNGIPNQFLQIEGLQPLTTYQLTVYAVHGTKVQQSYSANTQFRTLSGAVPGPVTAVVVKQGPNNTNTPGALLNVIFRAPKLYDANGSEYGSSQVASSLIYLVTFSGPAPGSNPPAPSGSWVAGLDVITTPGVIVPFNIPVSVSITPIVVNTSVYGPPVVMPGVVPQVP